MGGMAMARVARGAVGVTGVAISCLRTLPAARYVSAHRRLTDGQKFVLREEVDKIVATKRCTLQTAVPHLWDDDPSFSRSVGHVTSDRGDRIVARAPRDFEWILFREGWAAESRDDAAVMLFKLIDKLVPEASRMMNRKYTVNMLITVNHGYVQKAFVHAIILLSKWFGEKKLPVGVHVWPPPPKPDSVNPPALASVPPAPSGAASSSAPV